MRRTALATMALLLVRGGALGADNVQAILDKTFEARRKITSAVLEIDATRVEGKCPPHTYKLWLDPAKYRFEDFHTNEQDRNVRDILCLNCPKEGHFLSYSIGRQSAGTLLATLKKDTPENVTRKFGRLDVRGIGMIPASLANLQTQAMDSFIARPEWTARNVRDVTWHGQPAHEITLTAPGHPASPTATVTIVPSQDHSVVRLTSTFSAGGIAIADEVLTSVAKVGAGGLWYPSECTYTRTVGGNLEQRQHAVIAVKSLNEPIDPSAFELSGMGIDSGTVFDTGEAKYRVWNGKDLTQQAYVVPRSQQEIEEMIADKTGAPPRSRLRLAVLSAAALVFLLVAYLVTRIARNRQRT